MGILFVLTLFLITLYFIYLLVSVSIHYLPNSITHSTQIWHMHGYLKGMRRPSSNLVIVQWFFEEWCPFHFENIMKFSVFVHYLPNGITHSTQIWHIETSAGRYVSSLPGFEQVLTCSSASNRKLLNLHTNVIVDSVMKNILISNIFSLTKLSRKNT
jgi:hypothetical protein